MKLFAPEGSAEGCASGECLPDAPATSSSAAPGAAASSVAAPAPARLSPASANATHSPSTVPGPGGTARPASASAASAASPAQVPVPALAPPSSTLDDDDEAPAPTPGAANEHERWHRAVDAVRAALPRQGKSLSYARFLGFSPDGVRIAFPPDASFHRTQVVGMSRPGIEAELARALGHPGKLIEEAGAQAFEAAPRSIAEVEASDRATREKQIEAHVRAHPAVRAVLRHLGGGIEHIQYLDPVPKDAPAAASPDDGDAPGSD